MKYFRLEEFTNSKPPKFVESNLEELAQILEKIRIKWNKPIFIKKGYSQLNPNSQHAKGQAADIFTDNNRELFSLIIKMVYNGEIDIGQLIANSKWLHISSPHLRINNQIIFSDDRTN